jgi:hypothetical protein
VKLPPPHPKKLGAAFGLAGIGSGMRKQGFKLRQLDEHTKDPFNREVRRLARVKAQKAALEMPRKPR